ncbi:MAG TPA: phosphomannomutase/phosphoglucomutase [Candidatus Bathyarchaeia archaeon]|nr:phosphomannomutase/phosphoglucomutase [Candidatus Bathyarchaeia archaeon]
MPKTTVPMHIFRAYDIRGIYQKDLTPKTAETIGKAFGTYLGTNKNLAAARDIRIGGEPLKNAMTRGLTSTGSNIVDYGITTTPVFYFGIAHQNRDGGAMTTASHNPPEWNGFKLCRENGTIIGQGSGTEKIQQIITEGKFTESRIKGKVESYEGIIDEYSNFVLDKIHIERKLNIVLDTGNSVSALVAPQLFLKTGCKTKVINQKLNGTFPSHPPEPTETALQQLITEVKKTHADLGVGYDGDGDRAVFIDDKGRLLTGDYSSIIFARNLITKNNKKVVIDVSCSTALESAIKAANGTPLIERIGRPFMMTRVLHEKAVFGGERSGHFYFPHIYGLDDGTFASLKMAEILSKSDTPLSKIIDQIQKRYAHTINVPFPDEKKFQTIARLKPKLENMGFTMLDIDGVKAQNKTGWVLLRPSNTEPIIRIFAEAKTQNRLNQLMNLAQKMLTEEAEHTK